MGFCGGQTLRTKYILNITCAPQMIYYEEYNFDQYNP